MVTEMPASKGQVGAPDWCYYLLDTGVGVETIPQGHTTHLPRDPRPAPAAGRDEGKELVTGTQSWPQALGSTSNPGLVLHPNSPQPSSKGSQSFKFSFKSQL